MSHASYTVLAVVLAVTAIVGSTVLYFSGRKPTLAMRCVESLATIAKTTKTAASSAGDRLRVGDEELRLSAGIEREERAETKFLVGLRVDVSVDGICQPLSAGSVGVGDSREDAEETAIHEWAQSVGVALLGALRVQGKSEIRSGPFTVHPGWTGIRESRERTRSAPKERVLPSDEELLSHLDTALQRLQSSPGEFHSISILLIVKPGGPMDGECRVDGMVSPEVLAAVQSLPWHQSKTNYLFKRFYVLRRR